VCGVRHVHRPMRRHGWLAGRDQVARFMKTLRITGGGTGSTDVCDKDEICGFLSGGHGKSTIPRNPSEPIVGL